MVYCVGLTGQIASGKSTVATYFENLGIEVISADKIAKALTASNQPAFHHLIAHFGKSILAANGELDRRRLRQIIFHDTTERRWLENYLHPLIRAQIEDDITHIQSPYCVIEIPLLTDRSRYPYLNRVIVVQADPEQQIARYIARDAGSREEALAVLAIQNDKQKAIADDILLNNGSLTDLQTKVEALHAQYIICLKII